MTASKKQSALLQQRLKAAGAVITQITLRGRFHSPDLESDYKVLESLCKDEPSLQFPPLDRISAATRSNLDGDLQRTGKLELLILRAMLLETSDWHSAFERLEASTLCAETSRAIYFSTDSGVPHSSMRKLGSRYVHLTESGMEQAWLYQRRLEEKGIAIIGASCNFPGAEDLNKFWDLLCRAESQHQEVPEDRFTFDTLWRDLDSKRKWYGNFVKDVEAFDHKFFKKSPREMASADPQQRLMLQSAYQAVEQSGYFNKTRPKDHHVGCYIGVGLADYESNIACAPANAYSVTGNLLSFVAGKISHYFGWTGPGLAINTACSSAAVAIHSACKAILAGECTTALAGGVNTISSPEWFQNLAGASFLSLTGQCKPFDSRADGYCRGEGVGAVFLKKLSSALADGDQVLAVIGASAVFQNENCTPITVPNATSLSDLFITAANTAGIEPARISYVEAHGTGTPVGDPAEYDGVRRVFGGHVRRDTLSLGSVKGLVGHLESASGVAALTKIILMMHHGLVPPQASFQDMNPSIGWSRSDNMEVCTKMTPWDRSFKAALINNYGASGSNACLVISEPPEHHTRTTVDEVANAKYPIWLSGIDEHSILRYVSKLRKHIASIEGTVSVKDIAFQLSQQSNRTLPQALLLTVNSVRELEEKLLGFETMTGPRSLPVATPRPLVMCFGGQNSTFIGLDEQVYKHVKLLQIHLHKCDRVCQELGRPSFFPAIFDKSAVADIVAFQTMLFSLQYACALSWIDSGVQIAAVVGFSFGELTALCVSGILPLRDSLQAVISRAGLITKLWGTMNGSMLAVEGSLEQVNQLLAEANRPLANISRANIACFSGPTTFTLAGSNEAIDRFAELASVNASADIKSKRLNVTNAFHSALVDPLVESLETLGAKCVFSAARIPFYQAEELKGATSLTSAYFAEHMRQPVYFHHAVKRIARDLGDCIWLEAGSNSGVTFIAGRTLEKRTSPSLPVNITSHGGLSSLADATMGLWKAGIRCHFWAHHSVQSREHEFLFLPPYQFEKSRHWIDRRSPREAVVQQETVSTTAVVEPSNTFWSFETYLDSAQRHAKFRINNGSRVFQDHVSAHVVAQTAPLVASTLQLDITTDALLSLYPDKERQTLQPQLDGLHNLAPMSIDPSRTTWIEAIRSMDESQAWEWKILSSASNSKVAMTHVTGRLLFRSLNDDRARSEFARHERLIRYETCKKLLSDIDADEVLSGDKIYARFKDVVEYGDVYKGLYRLVGKSDRSAGRVAKIHNGQTWLDAGLADCFCQAAGIFINCMTDRSDSDAYISSGIDRWIRRPGQADRLSSIRSWEILAFHHQPAPKRYTSDVFVFDPNSGSLMEVISGIQYQAVSKSAMGKALSKLTIAGTAAPVPNDAPLTSHPVPPKPTEIILPLQTQQQKLPTPPQTPSGQSDQAPPDIAVRIREILCELSGLEPADVKEDSDLIELGIDSLMAMELGRELDVAFKCELDTDRFIDLTDLQSLINFVQTTLGFGASQAAKPEPRPSERPVAPSETASSPYEPPSTKAGGEDAVLANSTVRQVFASCRSATDQYITDLGLSDYCERILPLSLQMCVAYIVAAFEELGCHISAAQTGDRLDRIKHLDKHKQFVDWVYSFLEREAGVIAISGGVMSRTSIALPNSSASEIAEELIKLNPVHAADTELTRIIGTKLADCLTGKADAIQLVFGSPEGREIAGRMYGKSPFSLSWIKQMEDFLFNLLQQVDITSGSIRILEMGAGTGGTSARMVQMLSRLGVQVQYTVTDLSPSLVAAARKRFKQHEFVEYRVLDIEKTIPPDLLHSQHVVLATNCVHATHNLEVSTRNIHDLLRPDGFLLMLEMTDRLPWVELSFGLIEGWWLFNDGRESAVASPQIWERKLSAAGYATVQWTDGALPEATIQRLIMALASGPRYDSEPTTPLKLESADLIARRVAIEDLVERSVQGWTLPPRLNRSAPISQQTHTVVITGATGSLGANLVARFARSPQVASVVCMNRKSSAAEATQRQLQAFKTKGIGLSSTDLKKLKVLETDTSRPSLGLSNADYEQLTREVSCIIHNAWPMSLTRPIAGYASQFAAMRNLIDLARDARVLGSTKIVFQFISSIATAGFYPLARGNKLAPEQFMDVDTVLAGGYGDAKLGCEKMLQQTLQQHPSHFQAMTIRIGQISGSTVSGYWNPIEHFSFIVKSAQTLGAWPNLPEVGDLVIA